MNNNFRILEPNWNVSNVKAFTILAVDKNDNPVNFSIKTDMGKEYRKKLEDLINPSSPIKWIKLVHGNNVIELPTKEKETIEADGSFTNQKGVVCEVITADCLPITFTNKTGSVVGIAHAGRQGLLNNIISELLNKLNDKREDILVWIGPGISQKNYQISKDIRDEFVESCSLYNSAFQHDVDDKYLMDIYKIAKIQLFCNGILEENVYGAEWDTYADKLFHSARRDSINSGRMVTVIYIEEKSINE